MRYLTFLLFLILTDCVINPKNYTYKNKFSLNNSSKLNIENYLRTDCFYINSENEEYVSGKLKTYKFMKFYKNGRVYISKTFLDSIPIKEYNNFVSLEDIYIEKKIIDYNSGRKGYFIINENGILKIEQYINAGSGFSISEGIIGSNQIDFKKEKRIYKAKTIKSKIIDTNW